MTISINDITGNSIQGTGQGSQVTPLKPEEQNRNAAAKADQDTVSLTKSGKLLQDLEARLETFPVVDTDKVNQIRENLNSGNYQISIENIVKKFSLYENLLSDAGLA